MVKKKMFLVICLCLMSVLASVGLAAEPLVWLPLDDGAGTTAVDASGNGYDGTVGGDAVWVDGKYGGGLQFSGGGWVDLPVEMWNNVLSVNSTITFCFFHYKESHANNVSFGVSGGVQREFQSHLPWSSGTIYFDVAGTARDTAEYDDAWLGQWNHFCFMYASGDTKKLYCNG